MIKLAIIFNPNKFSGRLTKFFTGCYAYHVAWVDDVHNKMYDMNLIRRRTVWPHYDENNVMLFDIPNTNITTEYLEKLLESDENSYGWADYLLFAVRPLFHLFGRSTRNAGGVICSEMINNDIWACGGKTPWFLTDAPPSPCDFWWWVKGGV